MVFGNYGEASRDVHTLIHVAAKRLATKHWRLLGARSQGEVHGFYVAQLRRRMGVTAVREFARHRLRRAAYVGVPRAVVEQMMQQEAMRVPACTGSRRPSRPTRISSRGRGSSRRRCAAEVAAERRRARRRGCPAEGCLAVSRGSASLG